MKFLKKIFTKPIRMTNTANMLADAAADERSVQDFTKFKKISMAAFALSLAVYLIMYTARFYGLLDYVYAGKIVFSIVIVTGLFAYAMHVTLRMLKNSIGVI